MRIRFLLAQLEELRALSRLQQEENESMRELLEELEEKHGRKESENVGGHLWPGCSVVEVRGFELSSDSIFCLTLPDQRRRR